LDDERDALRVTLSVPGAPPGWTLARIAEDCGLSRSRSWLMLKRMLAARSIVRRKQNGVWHFYRSQSEQGQTR
jgi:hypothetical protein